MTQQENDFCSRQDELYKELAELLGDYPVTIFNIKRLFLAYKEERI